MVLSLLRRFAPATNTVSHRERARSACGALIGLFVTGLIARLALGPDTPVAALIAPMGASAVLLFAVPSSPLAQPWSILGGNLIAAFVGVTAAQWIPDPILASAVAGSGAIALMMVMGCLHPPSGAVALTAVLGGPAVHDLGYAFVLWPVGLDTALLLLTALIFNNLTGRTYPHLVPVAPKVTEPPQASGARLTAADIDDALKAFDEVLDIGRDDLEAILKRAQTHASLRRFGQTTCAAILTHRIEAIAPGTPLPDALAALRRHRVTMLPVTDESARVIGVVTQTDLIDKAVWNSVRPRLGLASRLRLTLDRGRAPSGSVEDVMTRSVPTLRPETAVGEAALRMTEAGLHHAPVVGADERIVGVVAQTDLVAAMLADRASELSSAQRPARSLIARDQAAAGVSSRNQSTAFATIRGS